MGRLIVVSLRSRGVRTINTAKLLDLKHQFSTAVAELVDITTSFLQFLSLQTWSTVFSLLITLFSVVFFCYFDSGRTAVDGTLWLPYAFLVLLVLLWMVHLVVSRRDAAHRELGSLKAHIFALCSAFKHCGICMDPAVSASMRQLLAAVVEDLHQYLQHPRPYQHRFPTIILSASPDGDNTTKATSNEIGLYLRQMHRDIKELRQLCYSLKSHDVSDASIQHLQQHVTNIHISFERISNCKEYGTPQAIKAALRAYSVAILPIFMAPFYSYISKTVAFGFPMMLSLLVQLLLMGMLNVGISLEDPFADGSLDAISMMEVADQITYMLSDDTTDAATARPAGQALASDVAIATMSYGNAALAQPGEQGLPQVTRLVSPPMPPM